MKNPLTLPPYSVLMSVYECENPDNLRRSAESMLSQSFPPDQFVLVIDGPVGEDLKKEIAFLCDKYDITLVPLEKNVGLGPALNEGLKECRNEIVARMDSDDVAFFERMQYQLILMQENGADIVSSAVAEFESDIDNVSAVRYVPETHDEIMRLMKKRNPFNHPAVVYKKSAVLSFGGYGDYKFFEDYELFVKMIAGGCKGCNAARPLVYMRSGAGMYKRRGGMHYVKCMQKFYKRMGRLGIFGFKEMMICALPRIAVAILPTFLRKIVYKKLLRG